MKKLKCNKCSAEFECGADDRTQPCWCMELPVLTEPFGDASSCLCPSCLKGLTDNQSNSDAKNMLGDSVERSLVEGEDFYYENQTMVFKEKYLLERGYCCDSGCRHCPY